MSKPESKKKEKKASAAKEAEAAQEEFDVSPYLEGVSVLSYKVIEVDVKLKKGQIRTVRVDHRDNLYRGFLLNPPVECNLLTVWDQGVNPPPSLSARARPWGGVPEGA